MKENNSYWRKDLFYSVFHIHISCGSGGVICIERWLQEKETRRRLRESDT